MGTSGKATRQTSIVAHLQRRIRHRYGTDESSQHCDDVDGELELEELGDRVVYVTTPHNRLKRRLIGRLDAAHQYLMATLTIEVKLSSVRMMSDASLATSVPAIP